MTIPPLASTTYCHLQQPDPISDSLHVHIIPLLFNSQTLSSPLFLSLQNSLSQLKTPSLHTHKPLKTLESPSILSNSLLQVSSNTHKKSSDFASWVDFQSGVGMLGTGGLNFAARGRGEDRFYNPVKARRSLQSMENDKLRRVNSDVTPSRSPPPSAGDKSVDSANGSAPPPCEPPVKRLSNLEQFLQAITPSVPAQYLPKGSENGEEVDTHKDNIKMDTNLQSKRTTRGIRSDVEFQPYFVLGDLWESFREWSAYGAGVPLVFNYNDSVVQYYVPFLSGIQIYAQNENGNASVKSRQLGQDSDSDFRDSSSEGSSDCEPERGLKYSREQRIVPHLSDEVPHRMGRLSLRDHHIPPQDGFSSDEGESVKSQGYLLFEYLERDPPYSREPLADKIADLALRFPELATLRSCDIQSSSWISVAWYPIYRIPTGPTLKDLDACFLTYHSLYTPVGGSQKVQAPIPSSYPTESIPKMPLPAFGLASYKFKGSLWTPNGGYERQLASSLLQAAENWLRPLQVSHPDFQFFSR